MIMKNPASAKRKQGSSKIASLAAGDYVDTLNSRTSQQIIAVRRLVARFGLTPSTALAIAEANAWGGANA